MSNPEVTRIEVLLERIVDSRSYSETPIFARQATGMAIRPMNNSEDITAKSFIDVNHASLIEWLINPQIILPNGDDFELDVIVWVAEDLFWIEAKTGDFQQYIDKYLRMAKLLKLPPDQTFMMLTRQSQENCHALSSLFNITVCDATHFTDVIQEAFAKRVARFSIEDTSSTDVLL